ncbi:TatD family hydrolase [Gaoshiqia sediminis]|uniref:TatD family hydrolase n=1 Tax=Gaoshiqia sediminis TaxID=2986998 RepID=A0AA41Y789_9BACT|nr:TatD family hydrolase [Gaoshiqia sediminis]MCW0484709.1 TatD family hydrolase [Gaoshiqia sediminis]
MKLVNFHTHLPLSNNQTGLINHPVQLDFLPKPGQYYSAGLHPWDIPDEGSNELLKQLARLANHSQVLAIGECGLDRSIETPIDLQQAIFAQQIELAEKLHKPLIIHAVRTYSDLLQLKKSSRSTVPWILHGYSGNAETTRQLIKQGFFFSFGAALLKSQTKLNQSLLLVPSDRLFFETDESTVNIESIYIFAASLFGKTVNELQSTVFENFQRIIKR